MHPLGLHPFHASHKARFGERFEAEVVEDYGDPLREHQALRESVGLLDFSYRGRICVLGPDRVRFLHGQVTNDIKALEVEQGCYAALISAKGKMVTDLNIYRLEEELLLDFEPGLTARVLERLEKFIIADDVQLADASGDYGLITVQGPRALELMRAVGMAPALPKEPRTVARLDDPLLGELYVADNARLGTCGFDWYVPAGTLDICADRLHAAAESLGARWCGWQAFETARIEAGIPRFHADMDETNLAPETGIEERAISYTKGCYIGQEVISRIRAYGQVTRALRGLVLADDLPALPIKGDVLLKDGKEVGHITSTVRSPTFHANLALGYARREANAVGTELTLRTAAGESRARIVTLPFAEKFA